MNYTITRGNVRNQFIDKSGTDYTTVHDAADGDTVYPFGFGAGQFYDTTLPPFFYTITRGLLNFAALSFLNDFSNVVTITFSGCRVNAQWMNRAPSCYLRMLHGLGFLSDVSQYGTMRGLINPALCTDMDISSSGTYTIPDTLLNADGLAEVKSQWQANHSAEISFCFRTGLDISATPLLTDEVGVIPGGYPHLIVVYNPLLVTTQTAINITDHSATLQGTLVSASQYPAQVRFEYGIGAFNLTTPWQSVAEGANFTADITGLAPNTLYQFRAVAQNTYYTYNGGPGTFTTLVALPTVTTLPATGIT